MITVTKPNVSERFWLLLPPPPAGASDECSPETVDKENNVRVCVEPHISFHRENNHIYKSKSPRLVWVHLKDYNEVIINGKPVFLYELYFEITQ